MAYSYDRTAMVRTAAGALADVTQQKKDVVALEAAVTKTIRTLARLPGMSAVSGPLDQAADFLVKARSLIETAEGRLKEISNR